MGSAEEERAGNPVILENETLVSTCLGCGSGVDGLTGGCELCGVGTAIDLNDITNSFPIPEGARRMTIGEGIGYDFSPMDLDEIIARLAVYHPQEYTYVVWRDIPVVVGPSIDVRTARDNFSEMHRRVERARLGARWDEVLGQFNQLREAISMLDSGDLAELEYIYFQAWDPSSMQMDEEFFHTPTFRGAISLADHKAGYDEAHRLSMVNTDLVECLAVIESILV